MLEIFAVTKKPCKRHGLGALGGRALLHLHRKERKELKDSGSSRERAARRVGESGRPKKRPIAPVTEENVEKEPELSDIRDRLQQWGSDVGPGEGTKKLRGG